VSSLESIATSVERDRVVLRSAMSEFFEARQDATERSANARFTAALDATLTGAASAAAARQAGECLRVASRVLRAARNMAGGDRCYCGAAGEAFLSASLLVEKAARLVPGMLDVLVAPTSSRPFVQRALLGPQVYEYDRKS
ncbi:hypothetical protein HK405_015808, partial [Cladochytrium tenue]